MNAKALFPLTAAVLLAAGLSDVSVSGSRPAANPAASATADVVDLPTITVRPAANDLAYYQANRIVDLAAVTVRPEPQDLADFLASSRVVEFPVVTVRPSAEEMHDVAVGAVSLVHRIATR